MKKLTKSAKIVLVSVLSAICVLGVVLGCIFAFPKKDPNNPNNPNNKGNDLLENFASAINKNNIDKNEVGFIYSDEYYLTKSGGSLNLDSANKIEKNYVLYNSELYLKHENYFVNLTDLDFFNSLTDFNIEDQKDTYLVVSYSRNSEKYLAVIDFSNVEDVKILNEYKDAEVIVLYNNLYYVIDKDNEKLNLTVSAYSKDSGVTYNWLYEDYPTEYADLTENIKYDDNLYYFIINKICYFGFYKDNSVISSQYKIGDNQRIHWYSSENLIYSIDENNYNEIYIYNSDNILSPVKLNVESDKFFLGGVDNSEYFYIYEKINDSGKMKYYDKNGNLILSYDAKSVKDIVLYFSDNILLQESGIFKLDKNKNLSAVLDFSKIDFNETLGDEESHYFVTSNIIINNTFVITDKLNNYIIDMNGDLVFDDNFESIYQYDNGVYFGILNNQLYSLDTNSKESTLIENFDNDYNSIIFGSGYYIVKIPKAQSKKCSYELYDYNGTKIKEFENLNIATYGNNTTYELEQNDGNKFNLNLNMLLCEKNEVESFEDNGITTYSKVNEISSYSSVSYSGAPDTGMTVYVQAGEYYYPRSGTIKSDWWTYIVVGIMKSLSFSFTYNYSSGTASISGKDNCSASFSSSSYSSGVKLSFSAKVSNNGAGCAGISATGSNMKDSQVWITIYSKSNYMTTIYNNDL